MASTTTRLLVGGLTVATLAACGGSPTGSSSSTTPSSASSSTTTDSPSSTDTSTSPSDSSSGASPTDSSTDASGTPTDTTPTDSGTSTAGGGTAAGAACSPGAVRGAPGLTLAQAQALVGKEAKECDVYKMGTPGFMATTLTAAVTSRPGWAEGAATSEPAPDGASQRTDPRSYVLIDGAWYEFRVWESTTGAAPTVSGSVGTANATAT